MRIQGRDDLGLLTYCTNIHAGAEWSDAHDSLAVHLPMIKAAACPDQKMGVGLRVSASMAQALKGEAARSELDAILGDDFYVFTINAFPYGTFHGSPVKANVYRPDWSMQERVDYSNSCADLLASLLPENVNGTISTVPLSFKGWDVSLEQMTANLVRHIAHLVSVKRETGRTIMMTLEPEPCCTLETIAETVDYFRDFAFAATARDLLASQTGLSAAQAEVALRRHLGVCYDVCHAAVEYEDAESSLDTLNAEGIAIGKLQLSSALRLETVTKEAGQVLAAYDEAVYLHQVVARDSNGNLTRYRDLPEALSCLDALLGTEWRVHFHVPVFLERLPDFGTTQQFLRDVLALHRENPVTDHLEVETYTWDVLPAELRESGLSEAIARELNWVRDELTA